MRIITKGLDAQQKLKTGVDALADAVKVTLGPKGRFVTIDRGPYAIPDVTKDGVSVAKEVFLSDPIENSGAQAVKEASTKTADLAGDGTTTATVLAQAMISEGIKSVSSGYNPIDLKRGIDKAVDEVVSSIKGMAHPAKTKKVIKQISIISANNDEVLGGHVADAINSVGKDGIVSPIPSSTKETSVTMEKGIKFGSGWASRFFINNSEKQSVEMVNPLILIYEGVISTVKDVMEIIGKAHEQGRPLVIIADKVDGEAMATIITNRIKAGLNIVTLNSPGFGDIRKEILEDIAVYTGANIISDSRGRKLSKATLNDCGSCENITVERENATIIGSCGEGEKIEQHVAELKSRLETEENKIAKASLADRLAKLTSGVAVINVGASSDAELKEKMDRIDDALSATRAAMEEGFVPGGGLALLNASLALEGFTSEVRDENVGIQIVRKALEAPIRQIAANAGISPDVVVGTIPSLKSGWGMNVNTMEYVDLIKDGVIDPAKVTRVAVESAASVTGTILMTGATISTDLEKGLPE